MERVKGIEPSCLFTQELREIMQRQIVPEARPDHGITSSDTIF